MKARYYYVKLAISGTGQNQASKVNIFAISNYLEQYSQKVAGDNWYLWLKDLSLSSTKGIEEAINVVSRVKIFKN